jgi:hypothetical protein
MSKTIWQKEKHRDNIIFSVSTHKIFDYLNNIKCALNTPFPKYVKILNFMMISVKYITKSTWEFMFWGYFYDKTN